MRISDWSSDVCSSDLFDLPEAESELAAGFHTEYSGMKFGMFFVGEYVGIVLVSAITVVLFFGGWSGPFLDKWPWLSTVRSEEHTSELPSLMRISYATFSFKKQTSLSRPLRNTIQRHRKPTT